MEERDTEAANGPVLHDVLLALVDELASDAPAPDRVEILQGHPRHFVARVFYARGAEFEAYHLVFE